MWGFPSFLGNALGGQGMGMQAPLNIMPPFSNQQSGAAGTNFGFGL